MRNILLRYMAIMAGANYAVGKDDWMTYYTNDVCCGYNSGKYYCDSGVSSGSPGNDCTPTDAKIDCSDSDNWGDYTLTKKSSSPSGVDQSYTYDNTGDKEYTFSKSTFFDDAGSMKTNCYPRSCKLRVQLDSEVDADTCTGDPELYGVESVFLDQALTTDNLKYVVDTGMIFDHKFCWKCYGSDPYNNV
jgi:hypothetical protein